jgi:ABC-type glutathione transport system ATPase component
MAADCKSEPKATPPILEIRGLTLSYATRRLFGAARATLVALQDISLELYEGRTLALVGPSGSGKSSLARCLVRLEQPRSGQIFYKGRNVLEMNRKTLKSTRREIQLIFQDSASALNSHLTIEEILAEPLVIHKVCANSSEMAVRVRQLMDQVGLPKEWLSRRPLELSGGQRQRVAIARSLALQPKILLLDEALSSLDLSTQGQIGNLLLDLRARHSMAYLWITHDLRIASLVADEVAVMDGGRIVRRGSRSELFTPTQQLGPGTLPSPSGSGETGDVSLVSLDK